MTGPLRRWGVRAVGLAVTGFGLYIVAPSVVTLLGDWPQLRDVRPFWFVILVVLECGSWVASGSWWRSSCPAVTGRPWPVPSSRAGGQPVPAGRRRHRRRPGLDAGEGRAATTRVRAATGQRRPAHHGMLLALPVLTDAGRDHPAAPGPSAAARPGGLVIVALVLVLAGLALLNWTGVATGSVGLAGRAVHLVRRKSTAGVRRRQLVAQRDAVAAAFAGRWGRAPGLAAGNRMLDYSALVASRSTRSGHAPAGRWCCSPTCCPSHSPSCRSLPVGWLRRGGSHHDPRPRRGRRRPGGAGHPALPADLLLAARSRSVRWPGRAGTHGPPSRIGGRLPQPAAGWRSRCHPAEVPCPRTPAPPLLRGCSPRPPGPTAAGSGSTSSPVSRPGPW